jgi:enoyl-CoA hydratase/carnithine racemase
VKYENLLVEKREDHIAVVTLNRPKRLNALNVSLMAEIEKLTEEFREDADIRVVIFTGAGKHFCGGADLKEKRMPTTVLKSIKNLKRGPRMIRKIYEMEQITIAAINGGAFGGGACIATACDFRIGTENCMAGFPESQLGMNLSWVSLPLVVHLIGPTYAKEMVILGKNNPAQTLLKWGFINEIVPNDRLIERALEIGKDYAAMPPIAAQMIKRSVNHISSALDQAIMHMDRDQWLLTAGTKDYREGIAAFFEKRNGNFVGD